LIGLFLHVDFDELPRHFVAERPGDRFQFGEFCASRHSVGIEFLGQFASHLAQAGVKFLPNLGGILAHFRDPLQVVGQSD